MAPQKSPAFSFYPTDFNAGTATMSLQEVGAYVRLLNHQWNAGSIPDNADERARIIVCSKAQERELWKRVGKKFILRDGAYINERLEDERIKQLERRRRLADNGSKGGRPPKANGKQDETNSFSVAKANENQNERLSSSSSSSGIETGSSTTKHRSVPTLIVGGGEYAKLLETHAFVGSVLRVPKKLHAELLGKSGGAHREDELQRWYLDLNDRLEETGTGTGDVFEWLRPRHQSFAKLRGWVESPTEIKKPFSVADALARKAGAK